MPHNIFSLFVLPVNHCTSVSFFSGSSLHLFYLGSFNTFLHLCSSLFWFPISYFLSSVSQPIFVSLFLSILISYLISSFFAVLAHLCISVPFFGSPYRIFCLCSPSPSLYLVTSVFPLLAHVCIFGALLPCFPLQIFCHCCLNAFLYLCSFLLWFTISYFQSFYSQPTFASVPFFSCSLPHLFCLCSLSSFFYLCSFILWFPNSYFMPLFFQPIFVSLFLSSVVPHLISFIFALLANLCICVSFFSGSPYIFCPSSLNPSWYICSFFLSTLFSFLLSLLSLPPNVTKINKSAL